MWEAILRNGHSVIFETKNSEVLKLKNKKSDVKTKNNQMWKPRTVRCENYEQSGVKIGVKAKNSHLWDKWR